MARILVLEWSWDLRHLPAINFIQLRLLRGIPMKILTHRSKRNTFKKLESKVFENKTYKGAIV